MSRKKTWLVALLSALVLFAASEAWAIKPVDPAKEKKEKKAEKIAPVVPTGAAAQRAPAAPAKKEKPGKPGKSEAAGTKAGVLPRPIEPAKLKTRKDPGGEERIVITNDDLTRIYGRSNAKPESPEYTEFLGEVEKREKAQQRAAARSQKKGKSKDARIAQIEADLDRLKKKLLGLRNPLLPRGKSTKEEEKAQKGMDNVSRVNMTKADIARLEAELAKLK